MIKDYEIAIIDDYVIRNNLPTMNLVVFKSVVVDTLPMWRGEILCVDEMGKINYEKYITYKK